MQAKTISYTKYVIVEAALRVRASLGLEVAGGAHVVSTSRRLQPWSSGGGP